MVPKTHEEWEMNGKVVVEVNLDGFEV